RSVLVATEKQVSLNVINVGIYVLRFGVGLAVVYRWPSIDVYLGWQLGTLIVEAIARRAMVKPLLRTSPAAASSSDNTWARAIPMYVLSVGLGAMAAQADKVILGIMRPVAEFGTYFIAAQVATGVLQLVHPLTTAALPRVVAMRAQGPALFAFNIR